MIAWARAAIALVWLYNGLWCKLLGRSPRHHDIVAAGPTVGVPPELVMALLGVVEVGLAVWVLTVWRPRAAAIAQTVMLIGMNVAGLLFARALIPDPLGMVVTNLAFLALVWLVARADAAR